MQANPNNTSAKLEPSAHAALEKARADALFASIGEGIIAMDSSGKITSVNQAALDILHFSKNELVGKWLPETIVALYDNGSAVDIMDRPITKAVLTGKPIHANGSYRRKDGTAVPVAVTVSPIMLNGKPIGAIEVFRDITLDIENDKMKTDFISVASHQLRTPLSSINVYARMLEDGLAGKLNQKQRFFVQTVLNSVERMNELINTLLNITRIEAGGITVQPAPAKLQELTQSMLSEESVSAKEKGLTLESDINEDLPIVKTDALLVKEVYSNLLSNAIKYTPEGGKIIVSLTDNGTDIIFSVRDTGYGIPEDAQERIFTKFFRADNILNQDVNGTGLGLYLTKIIAENLNGELWFESEEHKGSTFYFSIPKQGSLSRRTGFKLEA